MADPRGTGAVASPVAPASTSDARVFALTLSYDGRSYAGWQIQPDVTTVQGVVTAASRRLLGPDARVVGASRTDAGVHALRQVASLSARTALSAAAVQAALNALLPADMRVMAAAEVAPSFDARRAATGKRYLYVIDNGPIPDPLGRRYAWHVRQPLNVQAMRRALAPLHGRHDFAAFCAAPGRDQPSTCVVRALHVRRRRRWVVLAISADRYLHHMVRNVVGSAVHVGRGARPLDWLAEVLVGRDRTRAGPTAPAHGLILLRVLY